MGHVAQVTGISVQDLSASFLRSLRAENKSPRTVETYGDAVRAFAAFLEDRGMPTTVDAVAREHVEAWIQDLLTPRKPATAANRYRLSSGSSATRPRKARSEAARWRT